MGDVRGRGGLQALLGEIAGAGFAAQERLKSSPRAAKSGQEGKEQERDHIRTELSGACFADKSGQDDPTADQERAKRGQEYPKHGQERPRSDQERSPSSQERPKSGQKRPKSGQEPQERSREAQEPRMLQERPKSSKNGCCQLVFNRCSQKKHAFVLEKSSDKKTKGLDNEERFAAFRSQLGQVLQGKDL